VKEFANKIAVVTGGGTGMGRELVLALVADGAHVAMCDVMQDNMDETARLAAELNSEVRITTHLCDVSNEEAMSSFRDAVIAQHETNHIHLLFNNAGIGGGGSFIAGERDDWERTFGVCWYGVYYGSRAFLPLLIESDEGHIVNTSSVNGFWASIGHLVPHTAYAAAKFAVKGFTEALINDLRVNAPHVGVSLVMPGHIGTSIAINSGKVLGHNAPLDMTAEEVQEARERMIAAGLPVDNEPMIIFVRHSRRVASRFATTRRRLRRLPLKSFCRACAIIVGEFWWATMRVHLIGTFAQIRKLPTIQNFWTGC